MNAGGDEPRARQNRAGSAGQVPELSHTAWAAGNPLRRVTSTQPLRPGWESLPNSSLPERDGRSTPQASRAKLTTGVAAQRISSLVGDPPIIWTFDGN